MNFKYILKIKIIIIFLASLSGCGSGNAMEDDAPTGVSVEYEIVAERNTISTGQLQSRKFEIIKDQETFENRLVEFAEDPANLAIDFSTSQIALISMGARSSGGYSVDVIGVSEYSDYAEISVAYKIPGEGCPVTAGFTNPYVFVLLQSTTELLIDEQLSRGAC